jgi:hypothetical protein
VETTEYNDARDLLAMEAIYQMMRVQCLRNRVLLSREQFLSCTFPVSTTCDGILALIKAGAPCQVLGIDAPHPDAIEARH